MEQKNENKKADVVARHGEPSNVFFTLGGVAAILGLGVTGAEKRRLALHSEDPLVVQVLDSAPMGDQYQVTLRASNQTIHGIYLESAPLLQPSNIATEIRLGGAIYKPIGPDENPVEEPSRSFPTLVKPGQAIDFRVRFPLSDRDRFMSYGEIQLNYVRLDQKDPSEQVIRFRIRS